MPTERPYSSKDKWVIAIVVGILFIILASPYSFKLVSDVSGLNLSGDTGCPQVSGLIVNAAFFVVVLRLMMNSNSPSSSHSQDKWILALIGGLFFIILASPFTFGLENSLTSLVGINLVDSDGCPSTGGIVLNGVIFATIVRTLMK
jgi:hypothetical protein